MNFKKHQTNFFELVPRTYQKDICLKNIEVNY